MLVIILVYNCDVSNWYFNEKTPCFSSKLNTLIHVKCVRHGEWA